MQHAELGPLIVPEPLTRRPVLITPWRRHQVTHVVSQSDVVKLLYDSRACLGGALSSTVEELELDVGAALTVQVRGRTSVCVVCRCKAQWRSVHVGTLTGRVDAASMPRLHGRPSGPTPPASATHPKFATPAPNQLPHWSPAPTNPQIGPGPFAPPSNPRRPPLRWWRLASWRATTRAAWA
jgi:hypothetical protein